MTTPTELRALLACPFCGSTEISAGEVLSENARGEQCTQSKCMSCGAFGPEAPLLLDEIDYGSVKATVAWNTRITAALSEKDEGGWIACSKDGALRNATFMADIDQHICTVDRKTGQWYSRQPLPPLPERK